MGYTLPVRELLKGKANVHRIPENGSSTDTGVRKLKDWLGEGKWDVIHFNWGLHDLKHWKDGKLDPKSLAKLIAEYHKRHHAIYGYDMPGHAVEVVNLRLVVTVERKAPTHEKHKAARTTVADAVIEKRKV